MRQAEPTMQSMARRLLTHEAGEATQDLEALAGAAERTGEKLRRHLSKIIGPAGFQALLARALVLARAEFPWLAAGVERDGALTGLRAAAEGREPREAAAGFAAVLAHVLDLLVLFIGENLTRRLVHQVWPEAGPGEEDSGEENEARR